MPVPLFSSNNSNIISGLSPESSLINVCTWQVFWLALFVRGLPMPVCNRYSGLRVEQNFTELTATGIAPDFNRIPF